MCNGTILTLNWPWQEVYCITRATIKKLKMVIDEKTEGLFIFFNLLKQKKGKNQWGKVKKQNGSHKYKHIVILSKNEGHNDAQLQEMKFKYF